MRSSVRIRHGFGAGNNDAPMLEPAAALIREVLGSRCGSQRPCQHSLPLPLLGKLHSPDHLKSVGMGVMPPLLAVGSENHLQPFTPAFCSNPETLGKALYFFLEMEIPAEGS